ncbi:hypothetical protein M5K25_000875 [Dendrobium thyrsiflorum]|uniref:Uncharacterized protein n=1 Tax=Dendrobium thyrsiflorum TaxID=117978 RepID=A0ABD0VUW9_DENTH
MCNDRQNEKKGGTQSVSKSKDAQSAPKLDDLGSSRTILVDKPITEDDFMIVWMISVKLSSEYVNIVSGSLPSPGSGEKGHRFSAFAERLEKEWFSTFAGRLEGRAVLCQRKRLPLPEGWKEQRFSAGGRGCLCRKVGRNIGSLPEEEVAFAGRLEGTADDLGSSRTILVDRPITEDDFMIVWTISVKLSSEYVNIVSGSLPSPGSGEKGHRFSAFAERLEKEWFSAFAERLEGRAVLYRRKRLPLPEGWKEQRFSAGGRGFLCRKVGRNNGSLPEEEVAFAGRLTGSIPSCLLKGVYLQVLIIRGNQLHGAIPNKISPLCGLYMIDLRDNQLDELIPRSLSNCQLLEILDLGNNNIKDTFPYWLGNMSSLKVLVLRSNKFYGKVGPFEENLERNYAFSMLHVLDISFNNFSGNLCAECFNNFKSMMTDTISTVEYFSLLLYQKYYDFGSLTIMNKAQPMTIQKFWMIFKSIDFSNNCFEGDIPITIGQLTYLQVLNMSHNYLTGKIFPQLGNLSQLESLDLSMNSLSGKIPQELVSLKFLEYLNLSYNKLVGNIPVGAQFSTFPNTSFEGNNGLCLLPCNTSVPRVNNTTISSYLRNQAPNNRKYMIILGIIFGVGFGGSIAIVVVLDAKCCDRSRRIRSRRPIDG